ncbi:MAG: 2-oxo-4-hydroxy-4-carboxy-5-ureidoimidazoline decarboxylase [Planctomycetota bacterium]
MTMTLEAFDALSTTEAREAMQACCGSQRWCDAMINHRPFSELSIVHQRADQVFGTLRESDWLEAFAAHPKLGDLQSLKMKYAGNAQWSGGEQAGVTEADESVLEDLAVANDDYFGKFGFIFILCASGKSADQMLAAIQTRLPNQRDTEIEIAAAEQTKITHLRIDKLFK